jgi:hypothetical protein
MAKEERSRKKKKWLEGLRLAGKEREGGNFKLGN